MYKKILTNRKIIGLNAESQSHHVTAEVEELNENMISETIKLRESYYYCKEITEINKQTEIIDVFGLCDNNKNTNAMVNKLQVASLPGNISENNHFY